MYIFEIKRISIHCPFGRHQHTHARDLEYTCSAKEPDQYEDICRYCQCNASRLRWNESRRIDRDIELNIREDAE